MEIILDVDDLTSLKAVSLKTEPLPYIEYIDKLWFNHLVNRMDRIQHPLVPLLLQIGRLNGWYTYTYRIIITRSNPI